MEKNFNKQTPILKFPLHIDDRKVQNNKKIWILLPNIMYKILLPVAENQKRLNLFQSTILKLIYSGYKSIERLAKALYLNEELVTFVVNELVEAQLIDEQLVITKQGIAVIKDEGTETKQVMGYLFYDLLTKRFWDQIIVSDKLEYLELLDNSRLNLGTIDNPKPKSVFTLRADRIKPPKEVTPEIIYQTMQATSNRYREIQELSGQIEKNYNFDVKKLKNVNVKLISFGDPVYLATFMYLPIDIKQNSYWQVLHPFGYTDANDVRDEIANLSYKSGSLNNAIDKLLKQALEVSPSEMKNEEEKRNHQLILGVFGNKIEKTPLVLKAAVTLTSTYEKVRRLLKEENTGAFFDDLQTEFSAFVIRAMELIEECMTQLLIQKRKEDSSGRKDKVIVNLKNYALKNADSNLKLLHTLAYKCGFQVGSDAQEYAQLLKIRGGEITHAIDNKVIKGLLAVMLIYGNEILDFKIHKLADKFPTFLDFTLNLLVIRNMSAHISEQSQEIILASDIYFKCLYVVSVLCDTYFNVDLIEFEASFDEASLMKDRKLRLLSKQFVHHRFGPTLQQWSILEKTLSEMHYFKENHSQHFILKATSVVEYVLNKLLEQMDYKDTENLISEQAVDNVNVFEPMLKHYGFNFEKDALPQSFLHIQMHKVRMDLFNLKRSVPNVKLYALLALMNQQKGNHWYELAKAEPNLFMLFIYLIDLRKHGHVELEETKYEEIEQQLLKAIDSVVPYFEHSEGSI